MRPWRRLCSIAMAENHADFTLSFRRLCAAADPAGADAAVRELFAEPAPSTHGRARWRQRLAQEPRTPPARAAAMRAANPAFIPRNHRVEAAMAAAVDHDDFAPFEELLAVLSRPFEDQPEFARYTEPPGPERARLSHLLRHLTSLPGASKSRRAAGQRAT